MRKCNKILACLILAVITIISCNPADPTPGVDCSPINAGELNFTENTEAWFPYSGPETLVFRNEAEDTIRFRREEVFAIIPTFRYDGEHRLDKSGCPDSVLVRYSYPFRLGLYEADSLDLFIYVDLRVAPIPGVVPPAFFEALRVQVGAYIGGGNSRIITAMEFITDNTETLCPTWPSSCPEYDFRDSMTLLEEAFQEVYFKPEGLNERAIYYQQVLGVVGFGIEDELWVLEKD